MQYIMVVLGILIFIFSFPGLIRTQHRQQGLYGNNILNPYILYNFNKGVNFPLFNTNNRNSHSFYDFQNPARFSGGRYGENDKHQYFGENSRKVGKEKLEHLGDILKSQVEELRQTPNQVLELVFLVDSSTSVGAEDFQNELKFVKKLLADFTVDEHNTRVAVVTFSSESRVIRHINQLETNNGRKEHHKCSLLQEDMPRINYAGGGTYTLGAFLEAKVCQTNGVFFYL